MKVLNEQSARNELAQIEVLLDVEYGEAEIEKIMPAIIEGRLFVDGEEVKFILQNPIQLKNGEEKTETRIRVPSFSDMEYINRGFTMHIDTKEQTAQIDMAAEMRRSLRALGRLSDIPAGIIDRVSRRDMRVAGGLLGFFE